MNEYPHEIDLNAGPPDLFIKFLKKRFGKNWEIVRDHMAAAFINGGQLKNKNKALIIIGKTRDVIRN